MKWSCRNNDQSRIHDGNEVAVDDAGAVGVHVQAVLQADGHQGSRPAVDP